jgi:hypothetical protein
MSRFSADCFQTGGNETISALVAVFSASILQVLPVVESVEHPISARVLLIGGVFSARTNKQNKLSQESLKLHSKNPTIPKGSF